MKQVLRRLVILLVIFILAGGAYFYWVQKNTDQGEVVYSSMDEARLPVVYMEALGREMNSLHGYLQEMNGSAMHDCVTVLPEDRQLNIRIGSLNTNLTGIYYEIRSLDQSRLVERTSLTDWQMGDGQATAVLPIQNLLTDGQEYLLSLTLSTDSNEAIRYYTRILWTDNAKAKQMVDLAADFSARTFDYNEARELVTYLESNDTGDNTTLGHVDIHSSFSQLTWGGLKPEPAGEVYVNLKEYNGIMSQVQLRYLAIRTDTETNSIEFYEVEDEFAMRWDEKRVYLMDFDRTMNQIFTGSSALFTGKRIVLGITNDDKVQAVKSEGGQYIAFVANNALWRYDQKNRRALNVFSFRSRTEEGIRPAYDQHSMKILREEDNGDMSFLVYGYMNRGEHEGMMGVSLYQYSDAEDSISEKFFAPVTCGYEELKRNVETLSFLNASGMLYLQMDSSIYGIDLNSNETMIVAEALLEDGYAVSQDQSSLAWQEGSRLYESGRIHVMNLATGEKQEITAPSGDVVRTLGFVGNDLIYGLASSGSKWVINGRMEELPMYALEIVGQNMEVLTRYEKSGRFLAGVTVGDSRIQLKRIAQTGSDTYTLVDEDTIVCNEELTADSLAGIGWYTSTDREKLYFVQADEEQAGGREIRTAAPGTVAFDTSDTLNLQSDAVAPGLRFYAYGGGHLLGVTGDFTKAAALAHEKMGTVTDGAQRVIWNRADRPATATIHDAGSAVTRLFQNLPDFETSRVFPDGTTLLDARGCTLNQVLYFVGKGQPVLAYGDGGIGYMLTGYDSYNVTIFQRETGESWKMGLQDAKAYFEAAGNDFICGILP